MNGLRNYLLIIVCFSLLVSCSKKKETEKKTSEEVYSTSETESQLFSVDMNYDSLLTVVSDLQENVANNPDDVTLRQQMLKQCFDSSINMIITSGAGIPLKNAQTPEIAKRYAERAAKIDAFRWAVNVNQWKNDINQPLLRDFKTEIPPARIITQKTLDDSTIQVLVVINADNIK